MSVLPDSEIFIGLSALGLTVTGFSGLVAVLGRRATGSWTDRDRLQLEQLLELSIAVTFASLIPVLVSVATDSVAALSVATVLVAVFHFIIMARGFLKIVSRKAASIDLPRYLSVTFFVGGAVLITGAIASGLGYIEWAALFLLSNIVWLLIVALTHFVILLMNPIGSHQA